MGLETLSTPLVEKMGTVRSLLPLDGSKVGRTFTGEVASAEAAAG